MSYTVLTLVLLGLSFGVMCDLPTMYLRRPPQTMVQRFGAKCIDGTPPSMYVRTTAYGNSTNKWILFLEGGGWCFGVTRADTLQSCANWWGKSSNGLGPTMGDIGGFMSADPAINPDFYNWNMVFFNYCDGASFGSGATSPIQVNGQKIWMRGRANFDTLIEDLVTNFGMVNATVILSGGSAGGLAAFFNLDHLADVLGPHSKVLGFPDAGFFLDGLSASTNTYLYRSLLQGADPVWNVTGSRGTNAACVAAHIPTNDTWKCLFAPYMLPYIRTPLFIMNSAFDAYQVPNIFGESCLNDGNGCSSAVVTTLEGYRSMMIQAVKAGAKPSLDGCYIDSCYVHEQNVDYCSGQSVPNCVGWSPKTAGSLKWNYTISVPSPSSANSGTVTPQQAFSAWYKLQTGEQRYDKDNMSYFAFDPNLYITNPTCVWTGHPV